MNLDAQVKNRFNISEILKRLLLKVNKLEENNNSTTEEYIPLSGTEEGKPVTGNIELSESVGFVLKDEENIYSANGIDPNSGNPFMEFSSYASGNNGFTRLDINQNIIVSSENPNSLGLMGSSDFSEIHLQQKLAYAQRSYVERPQTLINCLNNATPSEITQIRTLLGVDCINC